MKRLLIAGAAFAVCASPAFAKKTKVVFVTSAAVKDKPAVTFDPDRAYVLVRSNIAIPLHLMRIPSEEDQVKYDALKAEAFTEAREKYAKKKASYDKAKAAYDKTPKGAAKPVLPEKPVEPTEANFEFTPFGLMTGVPIGPLFRFAKGDGGASTYLHELTPGRYRIYGMVSVLPNAAATGSCFCMGSVAFEVKAGQVTDLGYLRALMPEEVKVQEGDATGLFDSEKVEGYQVLQPAPASWTLDPRLAGATVVPAKFWPVGKMPNYFGVSVGRMPPLAGVMRYDRDRIIDLTGAQTVAQ